MRTVEGRRKPITDEDASGNHLNDGPVWLAKSRFTSAPTEETDSGIKVGSVGREDRVSSLNITRWRRRLVCWCGLNEQEDI